jgi:predicted DNA-binding transcriptional regulator AlpA
MPTLPRLGLLRWLLRELSTDSEDMIAFVASLRDGDDDDKQALLEELASAQSKVEIAPLRADYQDGKQLLGPKEALRILSISRAGFYALLKRGTFPAPILINDNWTGWPRDVLLEWADASERRKVAEVPQRGYAPFERNLWRKPR